MSLDDTLERPAPSPATLSDPASAWVTLGTCPPMAAMNNYPVAMQRNGFLTVISGGDGGDTVLTSDDDGATWNPPQTGDWPVRRALSGALHNGRFHIVGGFSPGQGFGDTLVSDDGLHFTQLGATPAPWGVRWAHTLLSAGDKLLMIAGVAGPVYSDEVWSLDADGAWTKIAEGQFTPRAWAAGAVLGSRLLVIGGWNEPDGAFAETLVSDDGGATWTTHKAPFTPRHSASAVTIGDTVYLVGGCTGRPGTTFYDDTWATQDGVLWTRVDQSFGPIGRTFATANLGGKVGVIGTSTDIIGLTPPALGWTRIGQSMVAGRLLFPAVADKDGVTYAIGGAANMPFATSPDGVQWAPLATDLPWIQNMAAATMADTLWATGAGSGQHGAWSSTNGATWTKTSDDDLLNRSNHGMVVFQDQLWVIGSDDVVASVVANSQDGATWNPVASNLPQSRYGAACVVFKGKIWVLGGASGGVALREAWCSVDGSAWDPHTPDWSARYFAQAQVIGDCLYLIAGQASGGGAPFPEVWATRDGLAWTLVSSAAPYLKAWGSTLRDGAIIAFGGIDANNRPRPDIYSYRPPQLPPA